MYVVHYIVKTVRLTILWSPCFRSWREEPDQEFVALCALLLCGDLSLKQDTFQAITNKQEVQDM